MLVRKIIKVKEAEFNEQIRPFPPTELIDQAEQEEALRLAPAPDLKNGYC
jgi:uncharacterized FlaG/YvyC family protein